VQYSHEEFVQENSRCKVGGAVIYVNLQPTDLGQTRSTGPWTVTIFAKTQRNLVPSSFSEGEILCKRDPVGRKIEYVEGDSLEFQSLSIDSLSITSEQGNLLFKLDEKIDLFFKSKKSLVTGDFMRPETNYNFPNTLDLSLNDHERIYIDLSARLKKSGLWIPFKCRFIYHKNTSKGGEVANPFFDFT
jgi:hypothetical protein